MNAMKIWGAVTAIAGLFLAAPAAATVTLQTSFVGTPVFAVGNNVTVRVQISANTTTKIPTVAAIRFGYDTALFDFVSATGDSANGFLGDIDPLTIGNEQTVSGSLVTRDIPTVGNFANTSLTPRIMDVVLQVTATSPVPTVISAAYTPGVTAGLNSLLDTNTLPITPRNFDLSATTNIAVPVSLSKFSAE